MASASELKEKLFLAKLELRDAKNDKKSAQKDFASAAKKALTAEAVSDAQLKLDPWADAAAIALEGYAAYEYTQMLQAIQEYEAKKREVDNLEARVARAEASE